MQTKLQKTRVIDRAGIRFPSLPELVRGEVAGVARPVAGVADGGEPDLAAPARIYTAAASRVKCRRMHSTSTAVSLSRRNTRKSCQKGRWTPLAEGATLRLRLIRHWTHFL